MKIAFYTPHLTFRGTCVAIYDYAHYCEVMLKHSCYILTPKEHSSRTLDDNDVAYRWMASRFPITFLNSLDDVSEKDADVVYIIKHGQKDDVVFKNVTFVVHCVFTMSYPHGKVYAAVSKTLAHKCNRPEYVPHMVSMNTYWVLPDLRKSLGIPEDATVFGRYGGMDTFNVRFARDVISNIVRYRKNIYFLFMNTPKWDVHDQIIHIPPIANHGFKKRFILSCDAMVVPEALGHTFGLSIGEFQTFNKPIICYNHELMNTAHVDTLGDSGIYFRTPEEFVIVLLSFTRSTISANTFAEYTPKNVMTSFEKVFLLEN